MVSVLQTWPEIECPVLSLETWHGLMERRRLTTQGFIEIEQEKGFIRMPVDLTSARGQEIVRLVMFRVLEEYGESLTSHSSEHKHEELIDSFNYLATLALLHDPANLEKPATLFCTAALETFIFPGHVPVPATTERAGRLVVMASELGDFLRNRPWMHRAQDIYFAGHPELERVIKDAAILLFESFATWDEFWRFFVAKDEVLQFRLRSKY